MEDSNLNSHFIFFVHPVPFLMIFRMNVVSASYPCPLFHSSSSFAVENNWRRPHPPERSSKIGIWIEKFRCQNSNLNLPTIKNGFYGYSYLKDPLRIMKRIWAQFWNPWVMPVTYVCLDSTTTQNSWRTSAQRTYLVFTFGRVWTLIWLSTQVECPLSKGTEPWWVVGTRPRSGQGWFLCGR